jgi:hypothetical protein
MRRIIIIIGKINYKYILFTHHTILLLLLYISNKGK